MSSEILYGLLAFNVLTASSLKDKIEPGNCSRPQLLPSTATLIGSVYAHSKSTGKSIHAIFCGLF